MSASVSLRGHWSSDSKVSCIPADDGTQPRKCSISDDSFNGGFVEPFVGTVRFLGAFVINASVASSREGYFKLKWSFDDAILFFLFSFGLISGELLTGTYRASSRLITETSVKKLGETMKHEGPSLLSLDIGKTYSAISDWAWFNRDSNARTPVARSIS